MFNRRLLGQITGFGSRLPPPVVLPSIVEERLRADVFVERVAGRPRSVYGVREIRPDPIPEVNAAQLTLPTRVLLPRLPRLARAGAVQAAVRDRAGALLALVEGADEAVAATECAVARIDAAGRIAEIADIARCDVRVQGDVMVVVADGSELFNSAAGTERDRLLFAGFVRARRALSAVGPRVANGLKRVATVAERK
jgi:hypothetical protein